MRGANAEHMAMMRSKRDLSKLGRKRNKFYDAIAQICATGSTVKLVFKRPRQAEKLARRMSTRRGKDKICRRLRGNTVVFWK